MNKTWKTALLGCILCSTLAAGTAGAASAPVEVKVQIGNPNVAINDQTIQVAKPYLSNNVTLVPLRVITSAFGAEVKWDEKTNSIRLVFENQTIELTIGKKNVSVDGVSSTLEAAPELSANTTMVPLRFITQTFGATVDFDAATSTITIRKGAAAEAGEDLQIIDQDADSTHIGDSYYGWSIEYLPELSPRDNEFSTDFIAFDHLKDEFLLYVDIYEDQPALSTQGLMKEATEYAPEGSILSQSYVKDGGYAKVVNKDFDGTITQIRVFAKDDMQYFVTLNTSADNFNDKQKWASYESFLDTFALSFDEGNSAYKDLSNVQDGYRSVEVSEYGLAFDVPAEWYETETSFHSLKMFTDEEYDYHFQHMITSIEPNDTPSAWANRIGKQYQEEHAANYLKLGELEPVEVDGIEGVARTTAFGDGTGWNYEYELFLMGDEYKYYFSVGYPEEAPAKEKEELRNRIVNSIEIDPSAMSPNLGELYDGWDSQDYEGRIAIDNAKGQYTIEIPELWQEAYEHDGGDMLSYSKTGMGFSLASQPKTEGDLATIIRRIDSSVEQQEKDEPSFALDRKTTVTLFGSTSATKYEMSFKTGSVKAIQVMYAFEKNGRTNLLQYTVLEPNATDSLLRRIQETIDSIEFK
jgi:hypothetical protein